jgi:hypothetical protein
VAAGVLARAADALDVAASIGAGRLQHLTIAAPGTTLTDVVAPFLATQRPEDPMPEVWEETPAAVFSTLARGADLALPSARPQLPTLLTA